MIEINNLNKCYNKGKKNESHVLNSISLSINEIGMVALFGKSGSGKTTLLNCIGGIDNYDSGACHINGVKSGCMERFYSYKRKNIGFVFQDYSLIDNQTVEDNLMAALKISEKCATLDKVNHALKVVGMSYYNKRVVGTLSGGQKQRVAIARALCIDPCVILADEPTGNLDQENTIKILDILKEISKNILVIIVSHERELVESYADRIIEIDNHRIVSDRINHPNKTSKNIIKNRVVQKRFTDRDICINLFYSSVSNDKLDIDISIENGNIYISGNGNNVLCVDNPYETLQSSCALISNNPDPNEIGNNCSNQSESTEIQPYQISNIKKKKTNKLPISLQTKLQRITAAVMSLTAVLLALTLSMIDGATKIDSIEYQSSSENAVALHFEPDSLEIEEVRTNENVLFLAPYTVPISFEYYNKALYQTSITTDYNVQLKVKPLPLNLLSSDKILYGKMPEDKTDVIIDKFFLDSMSVRDNSTINESSIFGITTIKSFIGGCLTLGDLSVNVVGISDTGTPTVYMCEELITAFSLLSENYTDRIILTQDYADNISTSDAISTDEVLVSKQIYIDNGFNLDGSSELDIGNKRYRVKGWYESNENTLPESACIVSADALHEMKYDRLSASTYAEIIVDGNVAEAIEKLAQNRIYGISLLEIERNEFRQEKSSEITLQFVLTIIVGFSALLCWCFSNKSIIAEHQKELSIKVALGIKRISIIKQYMLCTFSLLAIFALPVYVAMQFIIEFLLKDITGILSALDFSITSFLIGLLILITMPIIVTLISLREFIYKKPIDLLKKM